MDDADVTMFGAAQVTAVEPEATHCTGADIYRDAEACALEAMSFVRARN